MKIHAACTVTVALCLGLGLTLSPSALADDDPYVPGAHIPIVIWRLPDGEKVLANQWRYFADPSARPSPDGPPLHCRFQSTRDAFLAEARSALTGRADLLAAEGPTEVLYDAAAKLRVCKVHLGTTSGEFDAFFLLKHGRQSPQMVIRFLNKPGDYKIGK